MRVHHIYIFLYNKNIFVATYGIYMYIYIYIYLRNKYTLYIHVCGHIQEGTFLGRYIHNMYQEGLQMTDYELVMCTQ